MEKQQTKRSVHTKSMITMYSLAFLSRRVPSRPVPSLRLPTDNSVTATRARCVKEDDTAKETETIKINEAHWLVDASRKIRVVVDGPLRYGMKSSIR